ncbi:MAG: serine/threonine protein kinase, partial [Planctomycetales bacterium]|nr:serine/threonine protein kinase [Planctomycetales bacterium]
MLRPGDEPIPGYQLERFLGKGQFGQVWQSSSPGKTSLALKFLNLGGKEGWREFRSIQQIKGVRHAHLMPITALWLLDEDGKVLDDDLMASIASTPKNAATETLVVSPRESRSTEPAWLVVAQLLGDKTLADRLKEHQAEGHAGIPADELLTYMEEVAKGIDFLNSPQHDLGSGKVALQHCDIKPANILLMGGSVLICDFGVTRTLAGQSMSATATSMVGSPAYMAPECIEKKPSSASDQYSLAVTYYELRTGQLPFETLEYLDVLESHKRGKLKFADVPPAERKVLQRATSVNPKDRFNTTAEMVAELRRAVAGEPAPTKGRWPIVTVGALLVAAASLIGVAVNLIWNRPDGQQQGGGGVVAVTEWQLDVTPTDAEIILDGEALTSQPGGQYVLPVPVDQVQITVRRPPEYVERSQSFTHDELQQQPAQKLALRGNADYYSRRSEELRRAGDEQGAIEMLQQAISLDESLAKFPPTEWLPQPDGGLGSIRCLAIAANGRLIAAAGNK